MKDEAGGADAESTYVIREIYESENSIENFLAQLETALQKRFKIIVIEPKRLAEETGRWIMLGNVLSRLSTLCGLASITICVVWPSRLYFVSVPLSTVSIISRAFYDVSWNFDPASKYQVMCASSDATTLVYRDNKILNYAQRSVTLAAILMCGFQLYRSLK